MFVDINRIIEAELNCITQISDVIVSSRNGSGNGSAKKSKEKQVVKVFLRGRNTSEGIVYDKRVDHGERFESTRLGGDEDPEVIKIRQSRYDEEMLRVLEKNRKLLEKVAGKILKYDPDSIDARLNPLYRDHTGLVNKAPGIVSADEWERIGNKRNNYSLPDDSNITTDGTKARSKSELVIYAIIKGYRVVFKFDVEIKLKNELGQTVTVCPDFIILCDDGSIIIIEHLGMLNDPKYFENAMKKIHLYLINGYKLNETLFLTADSMSGKINAEAVDELIRKMILPKARRY